jgi:hypothetical protein
MPVCLTVETKCRDLCLVIVETTSGGNFLHVSFLFDINIQTSTIQGDINIQTSIIYYDTHTVQEQF